MDEYKNKIIDKLAKQLNGDDVNVEDCIYKGKKKFKKYIIMKDKKEIYDEVYNYKTKNKEGFVDSELNELLKGYPGINMDKFNNATNGNTCMMIGDELVQYHCDIYSALLCGIDNRDLKLGEWD